MKSLKPLFIVAIFSLAISSCTPPAIEENLNNPMDNVHATGNETEDTNTGTKD